MSTRTTKTCLYWLTSLLFFTAFGQSGFVKIEKQQFVLDGKPYRFIGTNLWYGMNLGGGNNEDRLRLQSELDQLQALGLTNLRIMAASEGPENSPYQNKPILQTAPGQYNEQLLEGLDFLLVEMSKPLGFDFFGIEDALSDALGVRVEMGTERSMHRLLRERVLPDAVHV